MKPLTDATRQFLLPCQKSPDDRISLGLDKSGDKFVMHLHGITPERAVSYHGYNFAQRIPERKRLDHHGYWLVGATDMTVAVIDACWEPDKIMFKGEDARIVYEYLLLSWSKREQVMTQVAKYHDSKVVPEGLELHPDENLRLEPYQQVACWAILNSDAYHLFMEQGCGKTATAINAWNNECDKVSHTYKVLIVAPKGVRSNWIEEINRFSFKPGKATALRGGPIRRMKSLIDALTVKNCQFTACVIAYESAVRMIKGLMAIEWDMVIVDEEHYIKRASTKRAQGIWKLREVAKRRVGLTGTPITNSPLDVYSQFEFGGKGFSGFSSWKAFKDFYGVYEDTQHGEHLVAVQNMPLMQERIARFAFVIRKEEALPYLPDKVYDIEEVEMTSRQREIYCQVRDHLMAEIERDLENAKNKQLVVNNILTKLLRLSQITSGFVASTAVQDYDGEVMQEAFCEFFSPNVKLNRLIEILKSKKPTDKTVVWACWRPDLFAIHEGLNHAGIDHVMVHGSIKENEREHAKWRFNHDPDCKVYVSNQSVGGIGTNLLGYPPGSPDGYETNANHEIFYSQNWSMGQRSQAEDRCHRRGTRENVRITDLVVPGTIDEQIRLRVAKKILTAYEVSDVKELVKSILEGEVGDD